MSVNKSNPNELIPIKYIPQYWNSIDEMIAYLLTKYGPIDDTSIHSI